MRSIYVVLPEAETLVSKVSKVLTRYPYSHITICLEDELEVFYSFSRLRNDAPLISGFAKEYRSHLASKQGARLHCKIFKIPLSERDYHSICFFIKKIRCDDTILFNYLSMLTLPVLGGFPVRKTLNCLSFAALVLQRVSTLTLPKSPYKFSPKDFDEWLSKEYFYFEGYLNTDFDYEDDHYFDQTPVTKRIKISASLIQEYMCRLLRSKVSKNYKSMVKELAENKGDAW